MSFIIGLFIADVPYNKEIDKQVKQLIYSMALLEDLHGFVRFFTSHCNLQFL